MRKSYTDAEFPEVFWSKISKSADPDGCWPWNAHRNARGYGQMTRKQTHLFAHRVAWELTYGPIPDGMSVLHRCDNPPCCRPDHLFLGTIADNNRDMVQKRRNFSLGPLRGEDNGIARLTDEQVREMRRLYVKGSRKFGSYALAEMFGVSQATAYCVVSHKLWTHVT